LVAVRSEYGAPLVSVRVISGLGVAGSSSVPRYVDGEGAELGEQARNATG
jgi:hypothetical protein